MSGADPALPRVGVFHAPYAAMSLRDLLVAARGLCTVVILLRESVAAAHPDLVAVARAFFEVAICPDDRTDDAVPDLGLAGVTTVHDAELAAADGAAARWGLPGAPAVADSWDKLRQRIAFRDAGVSPRRAFAVDSPAGLREAVAALGLPGALKPRRATASFGVALLRSPADVREQEVIRRGWSGLVFEELLAPGAHPSGVPWLAGYVSVETVSGASGHRHVAVFDKVPVAPVPAADAPLGHAIRETGDLLPSRLPHAARSAVLAAATSALDALGVRRRVTHTELAVSAAGVDVIEVNGRLGGEVRRMVGMLGGPDMGRAVLEVALGGDPAPSAALRDGAVATLYVPFPRRDGEVRSDASRADLRELPGVVAVDEVAARGAPRADTGYRAAKLTLAAPTAHALDAAAGDVLDRVAGLFAADGLDRDPWLCGLRDRVRRRSAVG